MKQLLFVFTLASLLVLPLGAALPAPDPDDGTITLPPGFRALVVADNLVSRYRAGALRFLSVAPNGDVYGKAYQNGLFALRDTNGDGRADVTSFCAAPPPCCRLIVKNSPTPGRNSPCSPTPTLRV